jgi:hypothetical protein
LRRLRSVAAGIIAMVVPPSAALSAQEQPPDSAVAARVRAEADSAAARYARDTIKAPLAAFPAPRSTEIAAVVRFSRDEIHAGGVMNLADLLDRVPGVTTFRTGWLAGVHAAAFHGDFRRVRVFLDGIELDAVDPRGQGTLDLVELPLWTLDEVVIERAGGEVRVWARSWSSDRVTPYTRADIFTGDVNTNAFRGLFARRYRNGVALQVAAQQLSTQRGGGGFGGTRGGTQGSGDQQVINLRFGWARRAVSLDAYGTATTRARDPQAPRDDTPNLPGYSGARREGYLRVGVGDTAGGLWSQLLLGVLANRFEGEGDAAAPAADSASVSRDTLAFRQQQVLAVGYRTDWLEAMALDRVRNFDGTAWHAPALRVGLTRGTVTATGYAERMALDSTYRVDVSARIPVRPWLVLSGAHTVLRPDSATERRDEETWRAEGGVRLFGRWVGGGYISQGQTSIRSPVLLGAMQALVPTAAATGVLGTLRGPVYKDLRADVQIVRWNTAQYARPRTHLRSELALASEWRSRFPKGEFGFDARAIYELREPVRFLYGLGGAGGPDVRFTERTQTVHASVEIRIQRARLFYLYRNLTGADYEQVPRILMPKIVQTYGVRWEFWN